MKNRGYTIWLLIVITLVGLCAAGRILWKRAAYEKANRTVQIAVDLPSLSALMPPGLPHSLAVGRLKTLGVDSFGVYEFKAKELMDNHDMIAYRAWPEALSTIGMNDPGNLIITMPGEWIRGFVPSYITTYFGEKACIAQAAGCRIPDIGPKNLESLTFGLHNTGLDINVIPRLSNTPFENEKTISLKMAALDRITKPSVIVFDGDSVLGYPKLLDSVAEEIRNRPGWSVGLLDMVEQDGAKQLAWKLPGRVIPAHGISEDEMKKNPPAKAVARFRRAVRERGIRFLYVRLYPNYFGLPAPEALDENIDYVEDIVKGVKADGYEIGTAQPLQPFISRKITRAACIAGAVAFAALLCNIGFGLPGWLAALAAVGSFLIAFLLPEQTALYKYFVKIAALGTACVVPGMSVAAMFLVNQRRTDGLIKPGVGEATARWAAACALTLAGGAFVAAMLAQREYFLRLDIFSGVKFAFIVPLLIVAVMYIVNTGEKLGEFFNSPMRYAEVALGVIAAAVLAIYLLRSGNQTASGGTMTEQESSLRAGLEALFYARPRFKEFLIGHPALLLVGLIPLGKKRYLGLALLALGVIGQISLLNSFCHLHTPIAMTYLRSVIGIMVGLVFGITLRLAGTIMLWAFGRKKNAA